MTASDLSGQASQVHFQRIGAGSEPLTFWIYSQDGLGKTPLKVDNPETAQQISEQVDLITQLPAYKGKGLSFKSINFSKALITFLDADGKEHTFALNHDDCPFLEEINHIIEGDKDFVKQFNYHGFHHYSKLQKGNTRSENGLIGTLTPRLKEDASPRLEDAAVRWGVKDKEAQKRAKALLSAKYDAVIGLIKDTNDELADARKNRHSQVLALETKLKKLQALEASFGDPDYDAVAFGLKHGFIDASKPLDEQVADARKLKQKLIDHVKSLPGNPRGSTWVQHDKHTGQKHTFFNDIFGYTIRTEDSVLDAEDRRMTAIAGMLIGSPQDRLTYCAFMKEEGREVESDPSELAILRFAFDEAITADQIRSGDFHVMSVDDPALQKELLDAIADELEKIEDDTDTRKSRGSEADGDKLKIDDDELDPAKTKTEKEEEDEDDGSSYIPDDLLSRS